MNQLERARNVNRNQIGRSIGPQTWAISPKIREVDDFLVNPNSRRGRLREIHPEVCFWALENKTPMRYSKKTAEGRAERLRTLTRYERDVGALVQKALSATPRTCLSPDDVLDAVVAFVTAEARHGELASLAGTPSHDPAGLPIEMLFLRTRQDRHL
jgi:predicted RNase H-like nuclease